MEKIVVAIDLGESLTKVIYKIGLMPIDWIAMHSGIARISMKELQSFLSSAGVMGITNSDGRMWIRTKAQGVIGIGTIAKKFVNLRQPSKPKYEDAVAKVLAAIALIVRINQLSLKGVVVNLGVLLPYDEQGNHKLFQDFLNREIASYEFCGETYSIELASLKVNSEGSGLALIQGEREGAEWIAERKLGVVMLGHRNTSAVYFDKGELVKAQSPLVGFKGVIEQIESMNPGLETELLIEAIWKVFLSDRENFKTKNYPNWHKFVSIRRLSTAHSKTLKKKETKQLSDSINEALYLQEEKLEYLFNDIFPHDIDAVIIGGGSATLFQKFLQRYFFQERNKISIVWNHKIVREIEAKLSMSEFSYMMLAERYLDLYSYFSAINN